MLVTDRHVLFFGKADPFSNWNPSPMRVALAPGSRGVDVVNGEQLFMAWKALHFADYATIPRILATSDPAAQKALGREVKPFDEAEWDRVSPRYMFKVLVAKYEQNASHRDHLLGAKGRKFVEASPYDRTWGVGIGQGDPLVHDSANWKGRNWLGLVHDMAYGYLNEREIRRGVEDAPPLDPRDFFVAGMFASEPRTPATRPARVVPGRR